MDSEQTVFQTTRLELSGTIGGRRSSRMRFGRVAAAGLLPENAGKCRRIPEIFERVLPKPASPVVPYGNSRGRRHTFFLLRTAGPGRHLMLPVGGNPVDGCRMIVRRDDRAAAVSRVLRETPDGARL